MAQTLNHNSAVETVTAVALPTFDDDVSNIQKLDDEPNDVGGMTSAQLKAEFDKAGETIADYINDTLIPAVLAQDSTEEARQLAEGERVTNEIERVSNENARSAAETSRSTAEASRVNAETARVTAETNRQASESGRSSAEQARATAETGRANAEETRVSNESARIDAEAGRVSAESFRVTRESARTSAESGRATAEGERATAEAARASAESDRASAETTRADNESTRVSNEQTRVSNEQTRVSNESGRISAEQTRQTNEAVRQAAETGYIAQARDAAEDSEAWAVGQRGGTDVPSSDETYHNNARYWAGQAQQAAGGGVTSFNGRSGAVTPASGDYTAAMVGLGNVPNVATNDQTPTYAAASTLEALTSGEKLSVALGKLKKAVSDLISHLADATRHITAAERTAWSAKQNALTFDSAPTSGSGNPVTSGGVFTAIANAANPPYVYSFSASDWTAGTDDATLTIAAATHGFTGSGVLAQFWHQVSGAYLFNTWACIESWAEIDASTHVVTLHGPTAGYAGKVILYG